MKNKLKKYFKNLDKYYLIFAIIIGGAVFGITLYRAITTGITYDEAFTYMNYVPRNPFDVFKALFETGSWANNHLLNSFLISLTQLITKTSYNEIVIRIPNLVFMVVYLIFAYCLGKKYKYKYLCFSSLAFNYGVCEFFGLARGYGISCSLVLVGLYFFKCFTTDKKFNKLILSYLFLILACYANTVSLIVLAAVMFMSFLYLIKNKLLWDFIKKRFYCLIPLAYITLLIIKYHFMVSSEGLPLYGSTDGFINSVLYSSMITFGFNKNYIYAAVAFFLGYLLIYDNQLKKCKDNAIIPLMPCYFLILIVITLYTKNMWLTGRCLITVWPLFAISVTELFDVVFNKKKLVIIISVILCLSCGLVFYKNINLKATRDWNDNYIIVDKAKESFDKKDCTIIEPYTFNEATRYYQKKYIEKQNYDIICPVKVE